MWHRQSVCSTALSCQNIFHKFSQQSCLLLFESESWGRTNYSGIKQGEKISQIKNCVFLKSFWLIVFLPLCLYWKLDFHENSLGHLDNLKLVGDYWESKLEIQVSQILQLTDNLCSLSWGTWLGIGVSLHASAYSAYLRNHVRRRSITQQIWFQFFLKLLKQFLLEAWATDLSNLTHPGSNSKYEITFQTRFNNSGSDLHIYKI